MNLNPFKRKKPKVEEKSWVYTDEGWLNKGWDLGWWQQNLKGPSGARNETVEACVSTLAQTVAMCPVYHLEDQPDGEAVRLRGSTVERTLLKPNDYTTRSQFFNTIIRCMYFSADGYAVGTRNGNGSIDSLYIVDPRNTNPVIDPETQEVYYWTSPNIGQGYNPDTDKVYLSRDVLHLRINVNPNDPLKGETPLTSAARSISANNSITNQQATFFDRMARPSGILSTPDKLTADQMAALREAVNKQTQREESGGIPILGSGMSWQSMSLSSQDSQMIEAFSMTNESISRVFRVPLPLINSMEGSTFNNAEAMMSWFLASGLGFLLEHIELELNNLFSLPFNQRVNFDTKALLRSDWKTQIETLGEGVLKGIYAPDEARARLGMAPVPGGSGAEPRVQQQVVPLSAWDDTPEPANDPVDDSDVMQSLVDGIVKGFQNGS